MIVNDSIRSGNKEIDDYIKLLEDNISKKKEESNIKKLIRSIDKMSGEIASQIDCIGSKTIGLDGKTIEAELDNKLVETFIKLVDKSDKLSAFDNLYNITFPEEKPESSMSDIKGEKKNLAKNPYEEALAKVKLRA